MPRPRALIALLVALLGLTLSLPAAAAPSSSSGPVVAAVDSTPAAFGGGSCTQTDRGGCTYGNRIVSKVNATKSGQDLWSDIYSLNDERVAAAVAGADTRGVHVHLLTWRQNGGDQDSDGADPEGALAWLISGGKAHGQLPAYAGLSKSKHSQVKVCTGSCRRSGTLGIHHAKVWVFPDGTLIQGSGNSTLVTDDRAWNSADEIRSTKIHDGAVACIRSSWADKKRSDCPDVVDGPLRLRFYPTAKADTSLAAQQLKKSHGYAHRSGRPDCHVVYSQFKVTVNRIGDTYDQLTRIKREGCTTVVAFVNWKGDDNADRWEAALHRMDAAGVEVWDASYVPAWHGRAAVTDAYDHEKLAAGTVDQGGHVVYWRTSGSATASSSAETNNDETELLDTRQAAAQRTYDRAAQIICTHPGSSCSRPGARRLTWR